MPSVAEQQPAFTPMDVAVVGGGLGGLAAAVALRRAGHKVRIFERRDFNVEVGASISCAANGTQWLHAWGVDVPGMLPCVLMKLVMRDWETGNILNQYNLEGYEQEWGHVYNMFHRQDMHAGLLKAATSEEGEGTPAEIVIDHICETVDSKAGTVTFRNGKTIKADLIIGADGIRSAVRTEIGIVADKKSAPQTCYRLNVLTKDIKELGLVDYAYEPAIQFWGGMEGSNGRSKYYKIVMTPCHGTDVVSFYCFMPTELTSHHAEGFTFAEAPVADILKGKYDELDPDAVALIKNSIERMPWRLYVHQPYETWIKDTTCLLGDAAHPMMPHQSQGACQAIEDAAALGLIFSPSNPQFTGSSENIHRGLELYERVRKPRATRVQMASARATENLNERIGFTSCSPSSELLRAKQGMLTISEMNSYRMEDHVQALLQEMKV